MIGYEDCRNVHTVLTLMYLPKLDEHDIVDYDDETKIVEPTPPLDDLNVYIEVLRGREIPWSLYYLNLAALAGLVRLAVDAPLFGALDGTAVAVFVVTAFAVSAALHYYYGERAQLGNLEKPSELRKETYLRGYLTISGQLYLRK